MKHGWKKIFRLMIIWGGYELMCQSQYIDDMGTNNSWFNEKLQGSIRKYRFYKRAIVRNLHLVNDSNVTESNPGQIGPGDWVRVRSRNEINKTLNRFRNTRGCTFFPEMYNFCGGKYKVLKEVEHFFDESKHKMLKCSGILLLEECYCSGAVTYLGRCNRNCLLFWQANWLERL
jgi:hypothetical protein